jgi:hypothetical protein
VDGPAPSKTKRFDPHLRTIKTISVTWKPHIAAVGSTVVPEAVNSPVFGKEELMLSPVNNITKKLL